MWGCRDEGEELLVAFALPGGESAHPPTGLCLCFNERKENVRVKVYVPAWTCCEPGAA